MKLYVRDKAAILLGKLYSMRKMDFQFFDIDDMMKTCNTGRDRVFLSPHMRKGE